MSNNKITYPDMVKILAKDGDEILKSLNGASCHLLHMTMGLVGEVLELDIAIANKDIPNILEECGDIEFYLQGLCLQNDGLDNINLLRLTNDEIARRNEIVMYVGLTKPVEAIVDMVKKDVMYQRTASMGKFTVLLQDFADQLDMFYFQNDLKRSHLIEHNMNKLFYGSNARYGESGYTDGKAQKRADKE